MRARPWELRPVLSGLAGGEGGVVWADSRGAAVVGLVEDLGARWEGSGPASECPAPRSPRSGGRLPIEAHPDAIWRGKTSDRAWACQHHRGWPARPDIASPSPPPNTPNPLLASAFSSRPDRAPASWTEGVIDSSDAVCGNFTGKAAYSIPSYWAPGGRGISDRRRGDDADSAQRACC